MSYEECHKLINGIEHKLCNRCLEWLPCNIEHYSKNNNKMDGFYPYCKKCNVSKTQVWRYQNPEHYRELTNKYNENRPEKDIVFNRESSKRRREDGRYKEWQQTENGKLSMMKSQQKRKSKKHKINKSEWSDCKNYFNNSCAYCGISYYNHKQMYGEDLHKEHVDDDGANDLSNCVPSCKNCNSQKWEFNFYEWYNEKNPVFSLERLEKILNWLNGTWKLYKNL